MPSPTAWQAGKQCRDLGQAVGHSGSRKEQESTAPRSDRRSEVGRSYLLPPHKETAPGSPSWARHRRFRPLPDGAPQAKGRQRCSTPRPSVQQSDVHHALLPRSASTSFLSLPALLITEHPCCVHRLDRGKMLCCVEASLSKHNLEFIWVSLKKQTKTK